MSALPAAAGKSWMIDGSCDADGVEEEVLARRACCTSWRCCLRWALAWRALRGRPSSSLESLSPADQVGRHQVSVGFLGMVNHRTKLGRKEGTHYDCKAVLNFTPCLKIFAWLQQVNGVG